jgi:hypothetical protein
MAAKALKLVKARNTTHRYLDEIVKQRGAGRMSVPVESEGQTGMVANAELADSRARFQVPIRPQCRR